MKYSASIVLYQNDFEELILTIRDLLKCENLKTLYLIDNSIDDRLKYRLEDFSDKINYIFLNKNIGFGSGHNLAIKKACEAGYLIHLIVNPDIRIEKPNDLELLVTHLKGSKNCGLVVPRIIYPNGIKYPSIKLLPNPFILLARRFLRFRVILSLVNRYYELNFNEKDEAVSIPRNSFASGCFFCVSIPTFNLVGGFDERFFMYMEDIDLCRKINTISEIHYISKCEVIHAHNKESYRNIRLLKIHLISAFKYFIKWWLLPKQK